MFVYNYEPLQGEYIGASEARLDPVTSQLEGKEVYAIPANATTVVPPSEKKGYARCFDLKNKTWSYVEDHRNQIVYNKETLEPYTIKELGPIPNIYIEDEPQPKNKYQVWQNGKYIYPDINVLRAEVKADLDAQYQEKLKGVYRVGKYYVQPSWGTIYTNTLVAMQQDIAEDGKLDNSYFVLLITNPILGKLEQIEMKSIEEFLPYYNKVKTVFKDLTEVYHSCIVDISNCTIAEKLVNIILNY